MHTKEGNERRYPQCTDLRSLEINGNKANACECRLRQAEVSRNVVRAELSAIPHKGGQPVEIIVCHVQLTVARIQALEALAELPVEVVTADVTAGSGIGSRWSTT